MYLLKLPSSVYYHRSPVPVSLRERSFPNEESETKNFIMNSKI
ncbi:hypothetical protein [Vibrio campbellii]|nr:hypothetical protein [Vibrio campbellii]